MKLVYYETALGFDVATKDWENIKNKKMIQTILRYDYLS